MPELRQIQPSLKLVVFSQANHQQQVLNLSLKVSLFICIIINTQLGQPAKPGLFSNASNTNVSGLGSSGQSASQPITQTVSQPNAPQAQSSQPNPAPTSLSLGGQGGTSGKKAL